MAGDDGGSEDDGPADSDGIVYSDTRVTTNVKISLGAINHRILSRLMFAGRTYGLYCGGDVVGVTLAVDKTVALLETAVE